MIYMRGLKAKEMTAVVDFIYNGEVNIFQEDLDGFLALADELELQGLTGSDEQRQEVVKPIEKTPKQTFSSKMNETSEQQYKTDEDEPINCNESIVSWEQHAIVSIEDRKMALIPVQKIENIAAQIESMIEPVHGEEFKWKCKVCGKGFKVKRDMARHVETHIEGMSYPCNQCGKISRSSHALITHVSAYHKQ